MLKSTAGILLGAVTCVMAWSPTPGFAESAAGYRFGALPFLPPERLVREYSDYADRLAAATGKSVAFETRADYAAFEQAVADNVFDIAWLGPFSVSAAIEDGYGTLVRTDTDFAAVIVTADRSLTSLDDLRGRTLGMPPSGSATERLARQALASEGMLATVRTYHFDNHPACFKAMRLREVSACVSHETIVSVILGRGNPAYPVIYETPSIPSSVIAIHDRVPASDRTLIVRALTGLQGSASGRELLDSTGIASGWRLANPAEYLDLGRVELVSNDRLFDRATRPRDEWLD